MEISKCYNVQCQNCGEYGNLIITEDIYLDDLENTEINLIGLSELDIYLCDKCLNELYGELNNYLGKISIIDTGNLVNK